MNLNLKDLYPSAFEVGKNFENLTYNPYWSKHPIIENYKEKQKEKIMNNNTCEYIERELKWLGRINNLKVLTEIKYDRFVHAYYIDVDQLDKTFHIAIDIERIGYGWLTTANDAIRDHFGKKSCEFNYIDTDMAFKKYCEDDVVMTKQMLNSVYGARSKATYVSHKVPKIKDVRFNGPATIVFWSDDTKTVVKAHNEDVDYEKGLAMAIAKKALGNKGNYFNEFKKWLPEEEEETTITLELDDCTRIDLAKAIKEAFCPKEMTFEFKVKEKTND